MNRAAAFIAVPVANRTHLAQQAVALQHLCDRDGGLEAGSGGNFGAGFASSTALGFSCGGVGADCGEAGSEFLASSVSFKSIKLAAIGIGVSPSISGIDKKKPNPQIINNQTSAASGNGHHRRISLDLELTILCCAIYV